MKIETIYERIRNELEDKFATKNNICFTKKTNIIYKHGNIDNHIERLNLETNDTPKSLLRIRFNSKQNLFYMVIISQGKVRDVTSNDKIKMFNICKKMIKYSTLEPVDYIEKLYKKLEY